MFNPQINTADPLAFLPRRPLHEYPRGSRIYDAHQADDKLYVTFAGRVKIVHTAADGTQTINRIVGAEELFGECSLIADVRDAESAVALEKTTVMSWTRSDIEAQIGREPKLAIALMQYFTRAATFLQYRLSNVAAFHTPERVALGLIQLAEELGEDMPDGARRVSSLTHQTIAEYVGTSREIVTTEMNRLRRMGMLRYSRLYVDVYAAALRESLREREIRIPVRVGENSQAA